MENKSEKSTSIIRGTGVSDGIAIGKVVLLEREMIIIPHKIIPPKQIESEIKRFEQARENAKKTLAEIKEAILSAESREPAFIIDAHLMMLDDDLLVEGVKEIIRDERKNAEWAIRRKVAELVAVFNHMKDEYLRERGRDVELVAERIVGELVGQAEFEIDTENEPVIVVAHELTPAETANMALDKVLGFVTDIGSPSSHAAIIAKSLRIPAVVGTKNVVKEISHGDTIVLDGHSGLIIVNPSADTIEEYESRRKWLEDLRLSLYKYKDLESETLDGKKITLAANIEIVDELQYLEESGAQGVGLYRTEYLYLSKTGLPTEDEQYENYKKLVTSSGPHGVTIRTLDIGGDKLKNELTFLNEANPALGLRAIRLCLSHPKLFKTQLRAILRASVHGKLRIMFPMISGYQEFMEAKQMLKEAAQELTDRDEKFDKNIEVGIMIEIPSAVVVAKDLAEIADFFSIGTNDLIQYTLAIDRINEHVSYLYQPLHPAVLRIIKSVADDGKKAGIPVYMCGAMAADSFNLPVLIGLGINELSMPMGSVLMIKRIMRQIKTDDAKALVAELLNLKTVHDIKERVKEEIKTKWAEAYALEKEAFDESDSPLFG